MASKKTRAKKVRIDSGIVLSNGQALTYDVPEKFAKGRPVADPLFTPGATTLSQRVALRRGTR